MKGKYTWKYERCVKYEKGEETATHWVVARNYKSTKVQKY